MLVVSMFIAPGTPAYEVIHVQTSLSELDDLKERFAVLACDLYIYKNRLRPTGHEISDCSFLRGLIGKISSLYSHTLTVFRQYCY